MVTRSQGPGRRWFWLRWSWRDLRAHWAAVVAIALVIAIGTGIFAGLGSTATWRRDSNDASFAALAMHDLRMTLSPGTFIDEGELEAAVMGIAAADDVVAVAERLVVDNQVDTVTPSESILVAARLVGMDPGADVDTLWVRDGSADGAVLEAKFADHHHLVDRGSVTIAGEHVIDYVGLGLIPEDFYYSGPQGSIFSQGDLAILYLPLHELQEVSGRAGQVNDVVLTLSPGADRAAVEQQLELAAAGLGASADVSTQDDEEAVRVLYEDIDNDQRFWNALSALIFGAAALAALNLVSRIVEAQRREIGIGMAMGVPRWQLAIRPLLIGLQVAVLGAVAGVAVGLWVGQAMADLLESFLPLPVYQTSFQVGVFARAAVLGMIVPIVASVLPVWRAVRVEPVQAIRTGHLAARSSRLTDWTSRLRIPGTSLTQMPVRNILRTPRRTILTAFGVGAAITALVAVLGVLDSFQHTINASSDELTKGEPDRVLVQLDTFYGTDSPEVEALAGLPAVGAVDPTLRLPATVPNEGDHITLLVDIIDFGTSVWLPTIDDGRTASEGIVIARKAASDLGVSVGDPIRLALPHRLDDGSFTLATTELEVTGIHANPLRVFAYADVAVSHQLGLDGTVNMLSAYPAEGSSRSDVQRAAFGADGVATTQAVARMSEAFDDAMEQFVGFLFIAAGAVLVLAMLIAFNATRIAVEERRREHATMMAFGLPVRSVVGVVVKESVLLGLAATAIGLVAGMAFMGWMLKSLAATTLPDLGMVLYLSVGTIAWAIGVGLVAVVAAPLFLVRRIRRMNIPDNLRVME